MGDVQQLQLFLEKNPYVPKEHIFVDGYDFLAYKAIGLGRLDEQTIHEEEEEDDDNYNYDNNIVKKKQALMTMTMPTLEGGWRGWWNYLTSASALAPIPMGITRSIRRGSFQS